jgi:YidC/Oxa1 family membrane protein insertase
MGLRSALRAWKGFRKFRRLPPEARALVFYAEDATSWSHFEPIVTALLGRSGPALCYLTSSPVDPILRRDDHRLQSIYIGSGAARTAVFSVLEARVVVMTMPDLETFHIKRSPRVRQYAYVHHSMVSTHMIYRPGAFDHFDAILCVGPHHLRETRAAEALAGRPAKTLVEHGYGRLDTLIRLAAARDARPGPAAGQTRHVLVAPSWGPYGILETRGVELVAVLREAGYRVTVRPHPMTTRKRPDVLAAVRERFRNDRAVVLETDVASTASLFEADVLISDWSGVALEYAFARERPVLFLDVPRKVNNPGYEALGIEPIEVEIRGEIGVILSPERLSDAPAVVRALADDPDAFTDRIRKARAEHVFHVGASGEAGAAYLARAAAGGAR